MLGELVRSLTNAQVAEDAVAAVATPKIMERIRAAADADRLPVGALVASRIRHLLDHGTEDIWLDLLGVMSGSPQPGAAAIERIIAYAFPDPVRVRIGRSGK
mgnify:CR=1 FL=1